jgi:Ca-activated chloride channel homolog
LALKYKVVIYTIGVGNSGLVKFGVDYFGRPVMIEGTFSDRDMKKISMATGGKYFWAKDAAAIAKILNEII